MTTYISRNIPLYCGGSFLTKTYWHIPNQWYGQRVYYPQQVIIREEKKHFDHFTMEVALSIVFLLAEINYALLLYFFVLTGFIGALYVFNNNLKNKKYENKNYNLTPHYASFAQQTMYRPTYFQTPYYNWR